MMEGSGIDPLSTPTWRKIEMPTPLRCCGIAVFFVIFLSAVFNKAAVHAFWLIYAFVAPIVAALSRLICCFYRIRSKIAAIDSAAQDSYVIDDAKPPLIWTRGMPLLLAADSSKHIHPGDNEPG
jgi:hypothetical protein